LVSTGAWKYRRAKSAPRLLGFQDCPDVEDDSAAAPDALASALLLTLGCLAIQAVNGAEQSSGCLLAGWSVPPVSTPKS